MAERDIGQEILDGLREIKAHKEGNDAHQPGKGGLRQLQFCANLFSGWGRLECALAQIVSLRTLQDWEQGRCQPAGSACMLLRIAQQHPEVFLELK